MMGREEDPEEMRVNRTGTEGTTCMGEREDGGVKVKRREH